MDYNKTLTNHDHQLNNQCNKSDRHENYMIVLERISAVAIGAFAAYMKWKLFVPFFFAGVCLGLYGHYKNDKLLSHSHQSVSSCASDSLEHLTGVRLPPIVSLAGTVAVAITHIDHHRKIFVPFTGITIGHWVGRVVPTLDYRKIIVCF